MKNQYAKPESAKFFFFAVGAGARTWEGILAAPSRGWKSLVLLSGDDDEAAAADCDGCFMEGSVTFPLLLLAWTSSDLWWDSGSGSLAAAPWLPA
jgi:hypothetical protein